MPEVTAESAPTACCAGFLEDKDIILAQQRILDLDPDAPMLAMRMDTALASFRAQLGKAIAAEREAATTGGAAGGRPGGRDCAKEAVSEFKGEGPRIANSGVVSPVRNSGLT